MQQVDIDTQSKNQTARWANQQQSLWVEAKEAMNHQEKPLLNKYLNYREYLRDYYLYKKKTQKGLRPYSYSVFAAAADIKSPNYLKLIIDGKRNLSDEMAVKFSKALQFNKAETIEFCLLVLYSQENDALKRNQYLRDIADLRVEQQIQSGEIKRENYDGAPSWVAWVLYTMCDQEGVTLDADKLKKLFRGKASEDQIRQALKTLVEQKQIVIHGDQFERHPDQHPKEVVPALVRKLQAELNYLGMESLFEDSAKVREFGTLTLALTEEEFERYRFELRQLRKRIHRENAVQRESAPGERVYQINLQLFPITESVTK